MPFQAHYGVWDETLKNQSLHIYTMKDTLSWQKKKDLGCHVGHNFIHWLFGFRVSFLICLFLLLLHDFSISGGKKIIFTFRITYFVIKNSYLLFSLGVPLLTGSCRESIFISLPFGSFILLLSILLTGKLTLISPCRTRDFKTLNGLFMLYSLEKTKIAVRMEHELTRCQSV